MVRNYKIVALIGDGVAHEIVPETIKVLKAAEETYGLRFEIVGPYECGAQYWLKTGRKQGWDPAVTKKMLRTANCISMI